jgi:tetratricopeptide (TPR) repeat protein/predicted aspartyl protease
MFKAVAFLGLLTVLAASTPASGACSVAYQQLTVTMEDRQARIDTEINGHPIKFIVDSGAYLSMISPGTAATFQLVQTPAREGAYMTGVGGDITPMVTKVADFKIGGVLLHNIYFLVGGGEMGGDTAGLLGQNVLHLDDVEYDLANGVVRLVRPKGCEKADMAYWDKTKADSVIPMESFAPQSRMTQAYAEIDGRKIKVMFDTGAGHSFVSIAAARRAGFDPEGPGVTPGGASHGIGRRLVRTWIWPVASFKIGDEEIRNTHLRVGDSSLPDVDMLLGADFFLSHHVYVGNGMRKIFFTYNGGAVFDLKPHYATDVASDEPPAAAPSPAPAATPSGELGVGEPKDAADYERRGAAYLVRREYAQAIADLTKAHELAPQEAGYLYRRGLAYRENRQPFLARADFDAALKIAPDDIETRVARAEMELAGRERASALADLDAAARIAPRQADVRLTLAGLYTRAAAFAAAAEQLDLWIHIHPEDARLENALAGRCWAGAMSGEDLDRAAGACDSALRRSGKDPLALNGRGFIHLRRNETDKAIADFNAVVALQPRSPWALYGRALAETRAGKADAAKADFAAAAAIRTDLPEQAKARGLAS